ncbi:MAG TPA: hypothetical protein P5293_01425 [Bacteroidales bacterium]|nr:hypothetical protein [Bacteroidales bacterium]
MKKVVFLCVILMVVMGCATVKVVDERGMPAPNYETVLSQPSYGFQTVQSIVRTVEVSPESYEPEYLDLFKKYRIPKDKTKAITITFRLVNPKGAKYILAKTIEYKTNNEFEFSKRISILHRGSDKDKTWVISCPLDYGTYRVSIDVTDDNGNLIVTHGLFTYIIK